MWILRGSGEMLVEIWSEQLKDREVRSVKWGYMEDAGADGKIILKRLSSTGSMWVCGLISVSQLQKRNQWKDTLKMVINIRVTQISGKILATSTNVRWRWTYPCVVVTHPYIIPLYLLYHIQIGTVVLVAPRALQQSYRVYQNSPIINFKYAFT